MLIGLAAKNSILIVEFAEQLRGRGRSIVDAAIEAARIRLRPILMTSFAFILGVLPWQLQRAPAPAHVIRSGPPWPGECWPPRSSPSSSYRCFT